MERLAEKKLLKGARLPSRRKLREWIAAKAEPGEVDELLEAVVTLFVKDTVARDMDLPNHKERRKIWRLYELGLVRTKTVSVMHGSLQWDHHHWLLCYNDAHLTVRSVEEVTA